MTRIRKRTTLAVVVLCFVGLVFTSGCNRGKRTTCSFYVKNLADPVNRTEAIRKVGELGCSRALIPTKGKEKSILEELYDNGIERVDVTRSIKFILDAASSIVDRKRNKLEYTKDPEEKKSLQMAVVAQEKDYGDAKKIGRQLLIKALKVPETAVVAASIVEEWKVSEAVPALTEVIKDEGLIKARTAAVKALAVSQKAPADHEDLYIWLLGQSPNAQAIDAFRVAVKQLGEARSAKSIPNLVQSLFLKNQRGEQVYGEARWALARNGHLAADAVMKVLSGEDAVFNEWANNRSIPDWEWRFGPKLIQILADLRDPRAAMLVVENIASPLRPLENEAPEIQEAWRRNQVNRFKVGMFAIAAMRNDEIIPRAKEIIMESDNDIQQRLNTASALAMMGTAASRKALFDIYKKSSDERFRQPLVIPISLAMQASDLKTFGIRVGKDRSDLVKNALQDRRVVAYRSILERCGNKADCYMETLVCEGAIECYDTVIAPKPPEAEGEKKSDEESAEEDLGPTKREKQAVYLAQREKAAMILSQLDRDHDARFTKLVETFSLVKSVYVDLKRYILMGIAANATKEDVAALQGAYDQTKGSKRLAYWGEEVRMLTEWAANGAGAQVPAVEPAAE